MVRETSVALYNRSCEQMAELPDASVDLIVTSPPYFVDTADAYMQPALLRSSSVAAGSSAEDSQQQTPHTYEELLDLLVLCFAECQRVLKPGRVCAVNVASTRVKGRLCPLPFDLSVRLLKNDWELRDELIWRRWRGWDRRGGVVIQNPYPGYWYPNRLFEYVLIFQKPGPAIYARRTEEEREASRIAVDDLLFHEINNNIWNILPVQPQKKQGHPCPYPDELAARLIELYSYKGDLVLDPFTGSGTTGKAARLLGRSFVGFELNPQFLRLAEKRIQEPSLLRERRICRFVPLPPKSNSHLRG